MELTAAILEVQETEKKNHEDVAALRMYLDTYVRSHEVIVTPIPATIATATSAAASPSPSPRPADTSLPTPTRALAVAPPSAPSPPPVAPMAAPKRMRSEADIAW